MQLDQWQQDILHHKGNICLRSGRQCGKSTIISQKAAEFAMKHPKKVVMIIASVERQAQLLFEKVLSYIHLKDKKVIKIGKDRPTKHKLQLKNGSVIHCLPCGESGYGIRGFTIDMLIADEAAFIPEDVWQAVTPMLATRIKYGASIVLLSTPFGKEGYFARCFNDPTFSSFHVSSLDCDRIDKTFLEEEEKRMTKRQFAQEYLGEFVDDLLQWFPDHLIRSCMTEQRKEFEQSDEYYLGVDIARMGEDESTFEVIKKLPNKTLVHVENLVTTKTLTTMSTRTILKLDTKYNFRKIYIDDGGIGVGVLDQLLEEEQTRRKVVAINNLKRSYEYKYNIDPDTGKPRNTPRRKRTQKEDLYSNLLRLMEQGRIKFLDDPEIFQSLKSAQYEYVGGVHSETRLKIFGHYTHICEGLIRAAWCLKDKSLNIFIY